MGREQSWSTSKDINEAAVLLFYRWEDYLHMCRMTAYHVSLVSQSGLKSVTKKGNTHFLMSFLMYSANWLLSWTNHTSNRQSGRDVTLVSDSSCSHLDVSSGLFLNHIMSHVTENRTYASVCDVGHNEQT